MFYRGDRDAVAEPLAALVPGPPPAQAGAAAPAAAAGRARHGRGRGVHRRHRGEPGPVHRAVGRARHSHRRLVDRCRVVSLLQRRSSSGNGRVTGTWEPDPERFPNGLKPVSDCAARHGADLLHLVRAGTGQARHATRPRAPGMAAEDRRQTTNRLLNLGNPACRQWLTDHVCRLIRDNGIKIYRQDSQLRAAAALARRTRPRTARA